MPDRAAPSTPSAALPRPARLVLVAGVARNGCIGRDNRLLWQLPADLARFRQLTLGHPVLMGRRTWESLPAKVRPLPGRRNVVLTRQPGYAAPGAELAPDLSAALARLADAPLVFVIGGEQVYREALAWADALELTEVAADFQGDAFFPDWDRGAFVEASREAHPADAAHAHPYAFVRYERA